MSNPTVKGIAVEGRPYREARVCLGPSFAGAYYKFFLTGTSTPAAIYQDGNLTTAFSPAGQATADIYGRFAAIYLDTSVTYKVQLFNSANTLLRTLDPYVPPLATTGTSSRSAYGLNIATTGEMTVPAPNSGGSGVSLTLNAGALGGTPLRLNGTVPGAAALIVNSSATTGVRTATFAASNKPGSSTSAPAGWLPITCDGVRYYTPIWHGNPFSPYVPTYTATRTYTSGSGTETVPSGATFLAIYAVGAGGTGSGPANSITATGGGGGGGGEAISAGIAVSAGQTLNYAVGPGGTNTLTTVTGNGGLSAVSLVGVPGADAGGSSGGGIGGFATGGNVSNTNGANGVSNSAPGNTGTPGPGGASAAGAAGGAANSPGSAPGGGGGGSNTVGGFGGVGANGQVQFVYT